jgi:hypothetical protein
MHIRTVILILTLPTLLSGCIAHQYREQVSKCEAQMFQTQVERVTCLNNASETLPYPNRFAYRNTLRLGLAKKVDSGEITQAEAEARLAQYAQQVEEDQRRHRNAMAGVGGALVGAGAR